MAIRSIGVLTEKTSAETCEKKQCDQFTKGVMYGNWKMTPWVDCLNRDNSSQVQALGTHCDLPPGPTV